MESDTFNLISKIRRDLVERQLLSIVLEDLEYLNRRKRGRKEQPFNRTKLKESYISGVKNLAKLNNLSKTLEIARKHVRHLETTLEHMGAKLGWTLWRVTLKSMSNVIINTSMGYGYTVLEIGFPLHHIYGIPYIPSSTVKGAWRAAFRDVLELCKLSKEYEKIWFGSSSEDGIGLSKIIVTDFLLVDKESSDNVTDDGDFEDEVLVPDIITPHYTSKVSTELDVQPVPIQFIALNKDLVFQGFVFIRDKDLESSESCGTLGSVKIGDLLVGSLKIAGKFLGIGGKTAVGYSRFEVSVEEVS